MGLLELNLSIGQIQAPTATMLHFLPQLIILVLAYKIYLVLMCLTAKDNGCPAGEMASSLFSIKPHT